MLASHCSEIDTRWPYEYGIWNFARRWPRTWSTANEQRKQVRCLQTVTRWHPNHTRRQHEDVNFYSSLYQQDTRRPHDGYTTSYWEYDVFELEHEGVTWPPGGIKLSAVSGKFSCWSEIIGSRTHSTFYWGLRTLYSPGCIRPISFSASSAANQRSLTANTPTASPEFSSASSSSSPAQCDPWQPPPICKPRRQCKYQHGSMNFNQTWYSSNTNKDLAPYWFSRSKVKVTVELWIF
jgi:hypothetical protein